MSLKVQFKTQLLRAFESSGSDIGEALKFLILVCVQKTTDSEEASSQASLMSTLIFMVLNLVRSEEYDIMIPSHTLKFKDELKEKEASYYELK